MKNFFISLLIGLSAAIVDVTPMMIQKLDISACISAFVQWIVLGLIIPYLNWKMKSWLKGLLVGEMAALPILVLVFAKEPMSIIPIIVFSAILGTAVGLAGDKFIKGI